MADSTVPVDVLVVSQSALVRRGFRAMLSDQYGIEVVGEASTVADAIRVFGPPPADVAIVDATADAHVDLSPCTEPGRDGRACRAIVVAGRTDDTTILELIRCGGSGYLLEDVTSAQLADAVRAVHAGGTPMDPKITNVAVEALRKQLLDSAAQVPALTLDERAVLSHMMHGRTNKEIGRALHLEEVVIRHRVSSILKKLGVRSRSAASAFWAPRTQAEMKHMDLWRETIGTDVLRRALLHSGRPPAGD